MKIAMPYQDGVLLEHFGRAKEFIIYNVSDLDPVTSEVIAPEDLSHAAVARTLKEHGVDVVLCGSIGEHARQAVEGEHMLVFSGITGAADDVLERFLQGNLEAVDGDFAAGGGCGGCGGGCASGGCAGCSAQDKYSFRRDVLAGMTGRLKLQSYVWDGYAAQLRSVQEYYDRSMELLQGSIRAELFAAARPILAKEDDEASSYFAPGSRVKNSLVADGCTIEGSVENCILFPGVTVEKGAELRDSILFKGTRVRDGVTLRYVITDKYVEVLPGRTLMGHESYPIVISKGSIV